MNISKLQIVRDAIARNPQHFNMLDFFGLEYGFYGEAPETAEEYLTTCGTAACIAGYTIAIFDPEAQIDYTFPASQAAQILQLSEMDATHIFSGSWSLNNLSNISPEEALWYLDGVIRTKDVYWNKKSGEYWPTVNGC